MQAKKYLVTGSAGFIGSATCAHLLKLGHRVWGIDSLNDYYSPRLKKDRVNLLTPHERFRFHEGNLSDSAFVNKIFSDLQPDVAIHLAAQPGVRYSKTHPMAYVENNLLAQTVMLEACRHHTVEHFVFASSSSVYGLNKEIPFKTTNRTDHPASFYGATKKACEVMTHSYAHQYLIPSTGLRFFTVYGPWGRPDMAPMIFTKALSQGETIDVFNNGKMQRDFTYIDDIVEGIVRLSHLPPSPTQNWEGEKSAPNSSSAPYRIFNIGNNNPVELEHFIDVLASELGVNPNKNYMPMVIGDVVKTYADVDDLEAAIQFSPKVSIEEGIHRFVLWYKDYFK